MIESFECNGQPRNMGSDQGRVLSGEIQRMVTDAGLPIRRSRIANLLPFTAGSTRGRGDGREVIRHFTHLSERMDGLARYAGVDVDSIFELHLRAARAGLDAGVLAAPARVVAGVGLGGASGVGLVRGLAEDVRGRTPLCVRRSRPEVGFGSIEVTLPWLVSSIAGVNEAGVCAAMSPLRGWAADGDPAAPSLLLVQECLQRFEDVEGCIDWCLKRPVLGDFTLVVADVNGETATIDFRGRSRAVDRREKGPVSADAEGPCETTRLDADDAGFAAGGGGLRVSLDADARRLDLARVDGEGERLTLTV